MLERVAALAGCMMISACGPAPKAERPASRVEPSTTAPSKRASDASTTLAPFVLTKEGETGYAARVETDGAVTVTAGDHRTRFALVGDTLQTADGEWIARINADGTVDARSIIHLMKDGKVSEKQESVVQEGKFDGDVLASSTYAYSIGQDGVVMYSRFGEPPSPTNARFAQLQPRMRRIALLLYIGLTFGSAFGPVERYENEEDVP